MISRRASCHLKDVSELTDHETAISKANFNTCLQIRRLLHSPIPVVHREGIKLLKIDVPTFDGDIMNWWRFWEEYEVSIHLRSQLTDAEKLAYLQQLLYNHPDTSSKGYQVRNMIMRKPWSVFRNATISHAYCIKHT